MFFNIVQRFVFCFRQSKKVIISLISITILGDLHIASEYTVSPSNATLYHLSSPILCPLLRLKQKCSYHPQIYPSLERECHWAKNMKGPCKRIQVKCWLCVFQRLSKIFPLFFVVWSNQLSFHPRGAEEAHDIFMANFLVVCSTFPLDCQGILQSAILEHGKKARRNNKIDCKHICE